MDLIEAVRSLRKHDNIALEKINDQDTVIHLIRNPAVFEPGFYRSAISCTYFHERELTKWHDKYYTKGITCPRWFDMKTSYESRLIEQDIKFFEEELSGQPNFRYWLRDLPIVEHKSVWDFYTYIKYDYKKKKWV